MSGRRWEKRILGIALAAVAILGLETIGCVVHWRSQGDRIDFLPIQEWEFGTVIRDGTVVEPGGRGRMMIGEVAYRYGFFERIPKRSTRFWP